MGKTYHRVIPANFKPATLTAGNIYSGGYSEYDSVDFNLVAPGRLINLNSIRVTGRVTVTTADNTNITGNANFYLDGKVGAHSFFSGWNIKIGGSTVENLTNDYPRLVKMKTVASYNNAMLSQGDAVCELKAPLSVMNRDLLVGELPPTQPAINNINNNPIDFSIKPEICVNNAVSLVDGRSPHINYDQVGSMKISCVLERNANVFYGTGMTGNVAYRIADLELTFTSDDNDGGKDEVEMISYLTMKQSVQSSLQNMNLRVPAIVDAVSASFHVQADEGGLIPNNTSLEHVPAVSSVIFSFDDSSNSYVSYELKNQVDVLTHYIESFKDDHRYNSMSMANVKANEAYGMGLAMPLTDLRNQRFGIQINSGINNAQPLTMYFYFRSKIVV